MLDKQILQLDDTLLYGVEIKFYNMEVDVCFLHPHNKNLCIKLAYNRGGTEGPAS